MRAMACLMLAAMAAAAAPVPKPTPPDPLGKGYMGVRVQTESLAISSVEPNTPASDAGLRAGDEFVLVGFVRPTNFDQVRAFIGSLRPGTRIDVIVKRNGKEHKTTMTLTIRPPNFDNPGFIEP